MPLSDSPPPQQLLHGRKDTRPFSLPSPAEREKLPRPEGRPATLRFLPLGPRRSRCSCQRRAWPCNHARLLSGAQPAPGRKAEGPHLLRSLPSRAPLALRLLGAAPAGSGRESGALGPTGRRLPRQESRLAWPGPARHAGAASAAPPARRGASLGPRGGGFSGGGSVDAWRRRRRRSRGAGGRPGLPSDAASFSCRGRDCAQWSGRGGAPAAAAAAAAEEEEEPQRPEAGRRSALVCLRQRRRSLAQSDVPPAAAALLLLSQPTCRPSLAASRSPNMATPATCTRFTDEYQLYEELGKYVARPPARSLPRLPGPRSPRGSPWPPGCIARSLPGLGSAARSAPGHCGLSATLPGQPPACAGAALPAPP